ncbi:MAG: hypothetical protein LUC83_10305 [Clostridiales bacterium]|nr:hypothetical protein [Clostridiales bacterium]
MKKVRSILLISVLFATLLLLSACGQFASTSSVTVAVPASTTAAGTASDAVSTSVDGDSTADGDESASDTAADETAADQQFIVEASTGLNGYYKSGAALPLSVYLESRMEDFEGVLRVIVPGVSYESVAAAYEQDIMLSADTGKTVSMSVDNFSSASSLVLQIEDTQGNVLQEETITLQAATSEKALVGVLSDDFTALNYFDGRNLEINDYSGSSQLVELSEDIFPEQSSGLEVLSYLIINSYDTSKLNEDQIAAIEEWVREGGILILGTGADYSQTLSGFESDFLTVSVEGFTSGTMQLVGGSDSLSFTEEDGVVAFAGTGNDAEDASKEAGNDAEDASVGSDSDVADASTGADGADSSADSGVISVENTADVLLSTDTGLAGVFTEDGLVFSREVGLGHVVLTAFNPGMEPVVSWNAKNEMAVLLLQESAEGYSAQRIYNLNYGDSVSAWTLSSILDDMHDVQKPNILLLTILLLAFVLVAGPVLYLILKKADRRGWMWFLVPVLSLAVTGGVFLFSRDLRLTTAQSASITDISYDARTDVLSETAYLGILVPGASGAEVTLEEALYAVYPFTAYTDDSYSMILSFLGIDSGEADALDYKVALRETAEGCRVSMTNDSTFASAYLKAETSSGLSADGLAVEVERSITGISGTVTNNTDCDMYGVSIYTYSAVVMIGKLAPGESASFTEEDNLEVTTYIEDMIYSYSSSSGSSGNAFYKKSGVAEEQWDELMSVLELFLDKYYFSMEENEACTFAWIPEWEADYIADENVPESNTAMVVRCENAPYGDYPDAVSLSLYDYSDDFAEDWDTDGWMYTDEVEVAFDLSPAGMSEIYAMVCSDSTEWGTADTVTVYGYNVETGEYEELFANDSTVRFDNGCPYLDADGIVRMKFVSTAFSSGEANYDVAPTITVIGGGE